MTGFRNQVEVVSWRCQESRFMDHDRVYGEGLVVKGGGLRVNDCGMRIQELGWRFKCVGYGVGGQGLEV